MMEPSSRGDGARRVAAGVGDGDGLIRGPNGGLGDKSTAGGCDRVGNSVRGRGHGKEGRVAGGFDQLGIGIRRRRDWRTDGGVKGWLLLSGKRGGGGCGGGWVRMTGMEVLRLLERRYGS